jgi:hypothetical protein
MQFYDDGFSGKTGQHINASTVLEVLTEEKPPEVSTNETECVNNDLLFYMYIFYTCCIISFKLKWFGFIFQPFT